MDTRDETLTVDYGDIEAAAQRLAGQAHRTPVLTSHTVDQRCGAEIFFKCENLQRAGAFKFRGAYNTLAQLAPEARTHGVVAYSSGNHAQAVALASRILGIHATIIMPDDAPAVKREATQGYGAEVITYDKHKQTRETIAQQLAAERGATLVPPFDHPHIVAGQGTAAKELIDETGALDWLLVPCGGGGLLSGCAIAATHLAPGIKVVGVEPQAGDDATRSFHSGTLQTVHNPETVADGARTHSLGRITFPLVLKHVHDMVTVDDRELLQTMFFMWERMKIVVEPTGALAATAVLRNKVDVRGKRVGVILSGGNVDLRQAAGWL